MTAHSAAPKGISQFTLTAKDFGMTGMFTDEFLQHSRVSIEDMLELHAKRFLLQFRPYGEVTGSVKYPSTWWDAVKDRFFPDWLKAKYPVKYEKWEYGYVYPTISRPDTPAYIYVEHNRSLVSGALRRDQNE